MFNNQHNKSIKTHVKHDFYSIPVIKKFKFLTERLLDNRRNACKPLLNVALKVKDFSSFLFGGVPNE
jgi:hypothetical protein